MRKWLTRCAVAAALIGVVLLVVVSQSHPPGIWVGKPLPPGKVRPQFVRGWGTAVLLAPDGSLWALGGAKAAGFNKVSLMNVFPSPVFLQIPRRVGTDSDWSQVAGGWEHTVALKNDGSLWAWGRHSFGQVGLANITNFYGTPTHIGTKGNWTQVCAYNFGSLALRKDGSLWAWGYNNYGQLGDGTTNSRSIPTMIGTERDWKTIAAGGFASYALKSNGTLWCWGHGLTGLDLAPRQIGTETNWLAISAYDFTMLALRTDGTLWLKSANANVAAPAYVPVMTDNLTQIGPDHDWVEIYPSENSFFARKKDGSWWGCGDNRGDQFGLGTNTTKLAAPQRLPFTFEPWAFAPEGTTTLLLGRDGKLWTWGERMGIDKSRTPPTFQQFLANLARRFPSLGFLIKSDIDPTPHLLWELPPEVRRSLGTGLSSATNDLTSTHK
jgi:alpha-tubulin suppressor-like RCC1 family protein